MKNYSLLIIVLATLFSIQSFADDDSYAASGLIAPYVQYPWYEEAVHGIRASPGWVEHKDMYGADFAMIGNITSNNFVGVAFAGGFNITHKEATVLFTQMAGVLNHNGGNARIVGVQMAILGYNYAGGSTNVIGLQMATIGNFGGNNIYGAQFGIYNEADSVYGFQIGVINKTKVLRGIQIGLANFSGDGGLGFFPVINAGF